MKRYITLILILSLFAPLCQMEAKGGKNRKEWFEKMREYKHQFLVKELGLTDEQQTKFFPLYDKMEDEIFKVTHETRQLDKKVSSGKATDLEYENAARAIIELKNKECDIELKYFTQFKSVLSSKQLFLLKKAERKFANELMKRHHKCKDRKGKGSKK